MKATSESTPNKRTGNKFANSQATTDGGSSAQGVDRSQLDEMIAVAAYFRAEQRGFAPGDDLDDWFQAEAEYLYRSDTTGKGS